MLPRLASLGKIVTADTIRILQNFVVSFVFDLYLRMEIMGKVLFLSEVVTYAGPFCRGLGNFDFTSLVHNMIHAVEE
jgi:hypothetical protein